MPLISGAGDPPKPRRKTSVPNALKALNSGTEYARRQAALDLFGCPEAAPALCTQLEEERSKPVRAAILDALVSIGDDHVVNALIEMLRSNDATARNEAVIALQSLAMPVAERMTELLQDDDPDLRIMALDILRLLPHPDAPKWIARLLEGEQHPNVVGVAVDRLADLGGPEHLAALDALKVRFAEEPYLTFAIDFVKYRIQTLTAEAGQ